MVVGCGLMAASVAQVVANNNTNMNNNNTRGLVIFVSDNQSLGQPTTVFYQQKPAT